MFHSRAERLHQRTTAACRWGLISIPVASLLTFGVTLAGQQILPPPVGLILRMPSADGTQLLRLHAQACRITETSLDRIAHPEVARALEQDLIWALTTCLAAGTPQLHLRADLQDSKILARFEEVRKAHPYSLPCMSDICRAVGVSERTLVARCAKSLGMRPLRYLCLRRLDAVRAELLRSDTPVAIVEVMNRYGFRDPQHFITQYVRAFGEVPLRFPPTATEEDC